MIIHGMKWRMILLGLLCSQVLLLAAPVTVSLFTVQGTPIAYRYQINGTDPDSWEEVAQREFTIRYESDAPQEDTIYLEHTLDGENWVSSAYYTFNPALTRWFRWGYEQDRVMNARSFGYSLAAGAQRALGVLADHYGQALTGALRVPLTQQKGLPTQLFTHIGYSRASSKDSRVESFHDLDLGIGGLYTIKAGSFTIAPSIRTGILLHLPDYAEGVSGESYYGDLFGSIGIMTSIGLNEQIALYAEGRVTAFPEKGYIGLLSGIETGLTMAL